MQAAEQKSLVERFLAEVVATDRHQLQASQPTYMVVGQVSGDVFVLGDMSPEAALQIVNGRRRAKDS